MQAFLTWGNTMNEGPSCLSLIWDMVVVRMKRRDKKGKRESNFF